MMRERWTITFQEEPPTTIAVFQDFDGFKDVMETAEFYGQHVASIVWKFSDCVTHGTP